MARRSRSRSRSRKASTKGSRRSRRRSGSRKSRRSGVRKSGGRIPSQLKPWMTHLRKFVAAHPNLSYKQCMKQAKKSFHSSK